MCILPSFSETYQQAVEFNRVHRIHWYKVKQSLHRPGQTLRAPGGWGSQNF